MGAELVDAREVCSAYVVNAPFARQQGSDIFAPNVVAFRLMARVKTTFTIPRGAVALRKTLLESGVLREQAGYLVFTSDYSFSSPSAAAAAVIGASANGIILWKLPDGRTYGDWEVNQDNAEGVSEDVPGGL